MSILGGGIMGTITSKSGSVIVHESDRAGELELSVRLYPATPYRTGKWKMRTLGPRLSQTFRNDMVAARLHYQRAQDRQIDLGGDTYERWLDDTVRAMVAPDESKPTAPFCN